VWVGGGVWCGVVVVVGGVWCGVLVGVGGGGVGVGGGGGGGVPCVGKHIIIYLYALLYAPCYYYNFTKGMDVSFLVTNYVLSCITYVSRHVPPPARGRCCVSEWGGGRSCGCVCVWCCSCRAVAGLRVRVCDLLVSCFSFSCLCLLHVTHSSNDIIVDIHPAFALCLTS